MFCHFITFTHPDAEVQLAVDDRDLVAGRLREIPQLKRAQLLSPAAARDRYFDDGPPPMLTIQLYYAQLDSLEQAAGSGGALQTLAQALPASLRAAQTTHQVMWTRGYRVPAAPTSANVDGRPSCCFLVHYAGEAADLNQWHNYYLDHHPPIMFRFPEIREIEIYTRVEWRDALPWRRAHHFQRNRIAFDSAAALERALHSPTRELMKLDFERFPAFSGGNVHHAMYTQTLIGPVFAAGS